MSALLGQSRAKGGIVICGFVYAELMTHPKATPEFVEQFLKHTEIQVEFDLGETIWREVADFPTLALML